MQEGVHALFYAFCIHMLPQENFENPEIKWCILVLFVKDSYHNTMELGACSPRKMLKIQKTNGAFWVLFEKDSYHNTIYMGVGGMLPQGKF